MKFNVICLVTAITMGLLLTVTAELASACESTVRHSDHIDSPSKLVEQVNMLLIVVSPKELDLLVKHPDCTVALAAGWERVLATIPREGDEMIIPQKKVVDAFIGLVERLVQPQIPEGWKESVKSVRFRGRRVVVFTRPRGKKMPTAAGAETNSHVFFSRVGEQWEVTHDGWTVRLPIEDRSAIVDKATVQVIGQIAYVALYSASPTPYNLFAVNRSTGKVAWSSNVWANGGLRNYDGMVWHDVFVHSSDDDVAVFGVSSDAIYVEVFNKETGENVGRFGTAYFRNR